MKQKSFLANSVSSYVPFTIDFALKILIVRMILLRLGPELLGTWGILKAATVFPLFLQQGISVAIFVQTSRKLNRPEKSAEALLIATVFGAVVALLLILFAPALVHYFRISNQYESMAVKGFRVSAFTFLFACLAEVFLRILQGLGRFDLSSLVQISTSLMNSAVSLLLLQKGFRILALLVIDLATGFIEIPAGIFLCWKILQQNPVSFSIKWGAIRSLLRETLGQLSVFAPTKIIWELDALLIPRFFGVSVMASYWIARRLVYSWTAFMWAGVSPAVPATSQASPSEDRNLEKIHWLQVSLAIPLGVFLVYFADSIIHVWIGKVDALASMTMKFLVVAGTIDFLPAVFICFLFVRGKVFQVAKILIAAAVLKTVFAVPASFAGNYNALLITTPAVVLLSSLMIHRVIWKQTSLNLTRLVRPLLPSFIASMAGLFVLRFIPSPGSLYALAFAGLMFLFVTSIGTLLLLRVFSENHYLELIAFLGSRFSIVTRLFQINSFLRSTRHE